MSGLLHPDDVIAALYRAADDAWLPWLDELTIRAGFLRRCRCGEMVPVEQRCGGCGRNDDCARHPTRPAPDRRSLTAAPWRGPTDALGGGTNRTQAARGWCRLHTCLHKGEGGTIHNVHPNKFQQSVPVR